MTRRRLSWFPAAALLLVGACRAPDAEAPSSRIRFETSRPEIGALEDQLLRTLEANRKSFRGRSGEVAGFGAGARYPQIWLRDSATLLPATRFLYPKKFLTSWIEEHLSHQGRSGALHDWIALGAAENFPHAPLASEVYRDGEHVLSADKNTTEADQEASAVIAASAVVDVLGESPWLDKDIEGIPLIDRLDMALQHVTSERFDEDLGLVVNAFTADWGDVSPVYGDQRAIYIDDATPLVAGIYTNAIVFHAARELARLYRGLGKKSRARHWEEVAASLQNAVAESLWNDELGFFRMHVPVKGSPPKELDDSEFFAMGGNALAALSGLATAEQASRIFAVAEARRKEYGLSTIAGALLPAYPTGFFQHPVLSEAYTYQNGGQWDWFAGRFVLAEFQRGYSTAAREHLLQLARRISKHDGLYEWYTREDEPRGSAQYAGNAGALSAAILEGLFGIQLRANVMTLRVRLTEPGEVEVSEPASGRRVSYSYRPETEKLELRFDANVAVTSIGVVLPRGRGARDVLLDGEPMPYEIETIGEDTYAVLTPKRKAGVVVVFLKSTGGGGA